MPTSNYSFPYPSLSTAPNIPLHFQELADAVDTELDRVEGLIATDNNTTYTISSTTVTDGARINILGSDSSTDFIDIKAGNSNITINATSDSLITISTDDDSPVYTAGNGLDLSSNEFFVNLSELSVFLGTTSVNLGRASGSLTLNGVSIDGSAGSATTATNLSGTTANSIPYQSASGTTSYITPSGTDTYLKWTGSAYEWVTVSSGSAALSGLTDVDLTGSNSPDNGEVLVYNSTLSKWVAGTVSGTGGGTVTEVNMTVPTGFTVSGSPITSNGTLAVSFDTGYSLPTTAKQTNWDTAYSWGDHSVEGYLTANQTINITGDATGSGTTSIEVTVANDSHTHSITSTVTGLGTNVATFLATPSSANLIAAITDETGSGSLVFGTSPTISTPVLTLATTTSTSEGRISWDSSYHHAYIGDSANLMLVPTFRVQSTAKTGAYTINLASDANTLIQMNGAFAFTVPADTAAPIGTQIHLVALTTGVTILGSTSGVLINGAARNVTGLGLRAAYSSATLIKLANDNWLLVGDLSA